MVGPLFAARYAISQVYSPMYFNVKAQFEQISVLPKNKDYMHGVNFSLTP